MSKSPSRAGIEFPLDDSHHRRPSSSGIAKSIVAAALQAFAAPETLALGQEKNWRKHYPRYFKAWVRHAIADGPASLNSAQQALTVAEQQLQFCRDGQSYSLVEAMHSFQQQPFSQFCIQGQAHRPLASWGIPYRGRFLQGAELSAQIQDWEQRGIIDPSSAQALQTLQQHPEWFDLSHRTVVLMGAGSEAGPLTWLSQWKANIIAIDLPHPQVWQKICDLVQQGNATLIAPQQFNAQGEAVLGADLLQQTPEIANWLAEFPQPLDLAGVAYLDGEKHVRVSLAMIAIMKKISALKSDSSIMFMLTPTDIYAVPERVIAALTRLQQQRTKLEKTLAKVANILTASRFFQAIDPQLYPADQQHYYGIADGLVLEQGPNYALAKRLQQWYALLARQQGQKVSINIAPSTTTQSVLKNPLLKAAFDGAELFAVEAFLPETTNAIMAALWVYDLQCPDSPANPALKLEHPLQLISQNANHGGLWSVAYLARTALPFAAIYGWATSKLGLKKTI
jgi:hypothetical protein